MKGKVLTGLSGELPVTGKKGSSGKRGGGDKEAAERYWRRKWQPTPGFLSGKSHRQRSLEDYSPWGRRARRD